MKKRDREIYKTCKMDCFNCPFPDCKMSPEAPDLSGIFYRDEVHIYKPRGENHRKFVKEATSA